MAKKKAAVLMSVDVKFPGVFEVQGTIISQDAASITFSHKKPRSKTMLRSVFPLDQVQAIYDMGGDGSDTVVLFGSAVDYDSFEGELAETDLAGFLSFTNESGTVTVRQNALAISSVDDGEEPPAAKSKGKAKAEPEDDDEEAPKGKAKPKAKAKAEPEEPEEPEYEPEVGDKVKVTDEDEDETIGTVTKITAKMITIENADEEEVKFTRADVTVEPAPKGKAKPKAKAKAEPEDDEEAPKSKAKPKGKAKADADDGGDW